MLKIEKNFDIDLLSHLTKTQFQRRDDYFHTEVGGAEGAAEAEPL